MTGKNFIDWTALILVIAGGLNWLFYAFGYNVVELLFGDDAVANLIYILIGSAAVYMIYFAVRK